MRIIPELKKIRVQDRVIILVNLDSPNWKSYIAETIRPLIQDHAIILY